MDKKSDHRSELINTVRKQVAQVTSQTNFTWGDRAKTKRSLAYIRDMLVVQSSNRSLVNQAFTKYDSLGFFELEVNKKKYEEWLDEYGNNLLSMNLQEDIDMEK